MRTDLSIQIVDRGRELDLVASQGDVALAHQSRVSALMVTRGRVSWATRAIACFLAQTWTSSELVVVDDDPDDDLMRRIAALPADARQRIVYRRLPAARQTLGQLRNLAVATARGPFVAQWDDDDVYHPQRLEAQLAALHQVGADACSLWRHQMLWRVPRRLCFSVRRLWEGSLLCKKVCLPAYPDWRIGEDFPVVQALARGARFALLDAPELYTYIVHGSNTFDREHFEEHWRCATERFEGQAFGRQLEHAAADLPDEVKKSLLAYALAPRG